MILNSSLNDLGLPRHRIATKGISSKLLASFGSAIADNIPFESLTWHRKLQITWDITFLLKLQPESIEENSLLMKKSVALRTKVNTFMTISPSVNMCLVGICIVVGCHLRLGSIYVSIPPPLTDIIWSSN